MNKYIVIIISFLVILSCGNDTKDKKKSNEEGIINVSVDESLAPIIQEQADGFMSNFPKSKINLHIKAEDKCWQDLNDSLTDMVITTKEMTDEESKYYNNKNKHPFPWDILAYDAMILIVNKSNTDTLMTEDDVLQTLLGKKNTDKKLIVDGNTATSSVRYIMENILKGKPLPKNISGVKGNQEVINFVSKNKDAIGFVGFSWIGNPDNPKHIEALKSVSMVALENRREKGSFVLPDYGNLLKGRYPYYRSITYVLKESYEGLPSKFRNYMQYEKGQLIFKRACFLPAKMKFSIRKMNIKELE